MLKTYLRDTVWHSDLFLFFSCLLHCFLMCPRPVLPRLAAAAFLVLRQVFQSSLEDDGFHLRRFQAIQWIDHLSRLEVLPPFQNPNLYSWVFLSTELTKPVFESFSSLNRVLWKGRKKNGANYSLTLRLASCDFKLSDWISVHRYLMYVGIFHDAESVSREKARQTIVEMFSRKRSRPRKQNRIFCGHCKEYLSKSAFWKHCRSYYDVQNERWITGVNSAETGNEQDAKRVRHIATGHAEESPVYSSGEEELEEAALHGFGGTDRLNILIKGSQNSL